MNNLIRMSFHMCTTVSGVCFQKEICSFSGCCLILFDRSSIILPFLQPCQKRMVSNFWIFPNLIDEKQYLNLVLICISLILNNVCSSSYSVNYLFTVFHIFMDILKLKFIFIKVLPANSYQSQTVFKGCLNSSLPSVPFSLAHQSPPFSTLSCFF